MKKLINLVLVVILMLSLYKIAEKYYNYYKDEKQNKTIEKLKPEPNNTSNKESNNTSNKEQKKEETQDLKQINSDYKFWIEIQNTNISYPVVQTNDNNFYLTKNFKKEDSISGSIFLDCNSNKNDKNLIIYGHNMKNKTMFNNLNNFLNKQFFGENNKITLILENKRYIYEVFSSYTTNKAEDFLISNFTDNNKYKEYINLIKQNSLYKKEIPINENDKIISLVTCSNSLGDSRIIVHGKLIKEDS